MAPRTCRFPEGKGGSRTRLCESALIVLVGEGVSALLSRARRLVGNDSDNSLTSRLTTVLVLYDLLFLCVYTLYLVVPLICKRHSKCFKIRRTRSLHATSERGASTTTQGEGGWAVSGFGIDPPPKITLQQLHLLRSKMLGRPACSIRSILRRHLVAVTFSQKTRTSTSVSSAWWYSNSIEEEADRHAFHI